MEGLRGRGRRAGQMERWEGVNERLEGRLTAWVGRWMALRRQGRCKNAQPAWPTLRLEQLPRAGGRGRVPGHAIISSWLFDRKPRPTLMTTAPTPSHRDQTSGLKPFCPSPGILEMGYL